MRLFYYVHTGHRIGLDRFRRAATILRALGDVDITLLTSDFRIAAAAREYGVKKAVGIDVVRNIPQIAQNGDKIIFDSDEINPLMHDDMVNYFSTFIRVCDDPATQKHPGEFLISPYLEGEGICTGVAVDPRCFQTHEKTIERAFFFGDDDYEEDLAANKEAFTGLGFDLLEGFYWFYDYTQKFADAFENVYDESDYEEVVCGTKVFLSASPQAVLENLAAGGRPIFLQRNDYPTHYKKLFDRLKIPLISEYDKSALSLLLDEIPSQNYQKCPENTDDIALFVRKNLDL